MKQMQQISGGLGWRWGGKEGSEKGPRRFAVTDMALASDDNGFIGVYTYQNVPKCLL